MKLKAVDSRYTPWVDRIRATASLRERAGLVPRAGAKGESLERRGWNRSERWSKRDGRARIPGPLAKRHGKTEEEGGTGKEGDAKKGGKKEKMGKWSRRVAGGGGGARKDDRPEREMAK